MKQFSLLLIFCSILFFAAAQPATDISCQADIFYGNVGNTVHRLQKNSTTITDLGVYATYAAGSLHSIAFGNDITENSNNRTLYSTTSSGVGPCYILRYTGSVWDTILTDTLIYHNAGGYGNYIYFQRSPTNGQPNDQCISRLNSNGTLTKIFSDTTLRFTVADISVDSSGNMYCFRGPQIGNTTELTIINPFGQIINSISTTLNNLSTIYGSMFLNGTLYVGWGTTNGVIYPVNISGSTATLGTGLPVPVGVSYKDLASCHEFAPDLELGSNEFFPQYDFSAYVSNASNELIIKSKSITEGKIELFDLNGRLLLENYITGNEKIINLHFLPQGFYFLRIIGEENVIATFRFIK